MGSATVLVWLRGVILAAGAATLGKQKVLQPVTKSPVNCKLLEAPPELAQFQKWCINSPHKFKQASEHCMLWNNLLMKHEAACVSKDESLNRGSGRELF